MAFCFADALGWRSKTHFQESLQSFRQIDLYRSAFLQASFWHGKGRGEILLEKKNFDSTLR